MEEEGDPVLAVTLQAAVRTPSFWPNPELWAFDTEGDPLVVNGTPVLFDLDPCETCIEDCVPCEVNTKFPPGEGERWVSFRSTMDIPPSAGDSEITFALRYQWQNLPCEQTNGVMQGNWFSNNGDELYGNVVNDLFFEGPITVSGLPVPVMSERGVLIMSLAMIGVIYLVIRRRRSFSP